MSADGTDDRFQAIGIPPELDEVDLLNATPIGSTDIPVPASRLVWIGIAGGQRRPPRLPPPLTIVAEPSP